MGVAVVWLVRGVTGVEFSNLGQLWPRPVMLIILWLAGWQLGVMLADGDKYLRGVLKGNSRVSEFLGQWSEGVRNVLTQLVLMILGYWLISSSGSYLAWGVVMGLQIRLLIEMATASDWTKWYTMTGREFNQREHRGMVLGMGGLILGQLLLAMRG